MHNEKKKGGKNLLKLQKQHGLIDFIAKLNVNGGGSENRTRAG